MKSGAFPGWGHGKEAVKTQRLPSLLFVESYVEGSVDRKSEALWLKLKKSFINSWINTNGHHQGVFNWASDKISQLKVQWKSDLLKNVYGLILILIC